MQNEKKSNRKLWILLSIAGVLVLSIFILQPIMLDAMDEQFDKQQASSAKFAAQETRQVYVMGEAGSYASKEIPVEVQEITATEIGSEFTKNKYRAESKYKDIGVFLLQGIFSSFDKGFDHTEEVVEVLVLNGSPQSYEETIYVLNKGLSRDRLESFDAKSTITIKVKYKGINSNGTPIFEIVD